MVFFRIINLYEMHPNLHLTLNFFNFMQAGSERRIESAKWDLTIGPNLVKILGWGRVPGVRWGGLV